MAYFFKAKEGVVPGQRGGRFSCGLPTAMPVPMGMPRFKFHQVNNLSVGSFL